MPQIEVFGDFDSNNPLAAAILAHSILEQRVKLSDDVSIGIFDDDTSIPLTSGNYAYKCHGLIAKTADMENGENYPHTHYEVRIEIHLERVPCPDDIHQN